MLYKRNYEFINFEITMFYEILLGLNMQHDTFFMKLL